MGRGGDLGAARRTVIPPEERPARALRWIVDTFRAARIPHLVVGGLAARAHGATRPLADIDLYVPSSRFGEARRAVAQRLVHGPAHHRDECWDLTFLALEVEGVRIEIGAADEARLFDRAAGRWVPAAVDFRRAEEREVLGVTVPVMVREDLIAYKARLGRPVDRQDLAELEVAAHPTTDPPAWAGREAAMSLTLTSPAFSPGGAIPTRFTCEGQDVSPALAWTEVPAGAKSLALIVDDPDAPDPKAPKMTYVHWVLYNIPTTAGGLPEAVAAADLPEGTREGLNDWKRTGYGGPCPPIGRHRYFHKLYALDAVLPDLGTPTKARLEAAMEGHVVARAELMGTYQLTKPRG